MRIDLLLLERSGFTYENYITTKITPTFDKKGVPYNKIYLGEGILHDYLHYIQESPPNRMVSFAPILNYETPFCDFVNIPQSVWVESSLSEAANFLPSKWGRVLLPRPHSQALYLPHGIEIRPPKEPLFDVAFFSPLVDIESLKERWREFFSEEEIDLLLEESIVPGSLLAALEEFQKAKRAYPVISTSPFPLHVFGEHIGNNWYRRLPNAPLVHLHAPLPYTEYFEVLARSRIAIFDPLDSQWCAAAAATGCLPLLADAEDLHDQVGYFLADSKKREKALESYQDQIQALTWENQVIRLIEHLYEN